MKKQSLALALLCLLFSCKTSQKTTNPTSDDGKLSFIFLQLNDVYEMSPLQNGQVGGMARVATLRQKLLKENPRVITVLAGDFISPSVIGTLKFEGKRIRGKQMVEVMNALGVDYVTFGNHEFDYDLVDLQARLNESKFTWIATNVFQKESDGSMNSFHQNLTPCPPSVRFDLKDADGTTVKLGIFSSTIPSNPKAYVEYEGQFVAPKLAADELKKDCDQVFGLTHLAREDDAKLALDVPYVPLIMGGHEHDNMRFLSGKTVIAKADANAKTVYVHRVLIDKKAKTCKIESELVEIGPKFQDDESVGAVVKKWENIQAENFKAMGFDPNEMVTTLKKTLDCRETVVRNQQSDAGGLLTASMLAVSREKADCALINAGSIRLDDKLTGKITQFDVMRMLPFGGGFSEVEMKGAFLRKILEAGLANKGRGGYLDWGNISYVWSGRSFANDVKVLAVGNAPLDDSKNYRVILADFLLTGNEQGLDFLKMEGNANLKLLSKRDANDKTDLRNDIRLALIDYLKKQKN